MATRIQVRRDTAANWTTSGTTVLAAGEIGFETDTLLFKIGDGSQQWQNLEYAGGTEPIRNNPSGTSVTDLNAAALRNNGNSKYLILGAGSVTNGPSGLNTPTDGQLMVTVAKFDYTGTSAANERYLMTLQTLTTNKWFTRVWSGSAWSSWVEVIQTPFTGNLTISGDIAVNGGDITTSSATASVFDTSATTLNVGGAATTLNVADDVITAQTINIGTGATGTGATKTINIGTGGATGSTTNVNIGDADGGTVAVGKDMTVGGTLAVTGNSTLTGDLAVNGGDITTSSATASVFNATATTLNVGGAATAINVGTGAGTVTVAGDLAVNGGDITTNQTTASVFNATATTLNVGQAATAVSIGATTGTATIRNATTAISGAATVGSTLAVTGNTTLTGDLAVNGGDITTTSATASVFDTTATTLNIGGAATTLNVADDVTAAQTINIGTGATGTGATKTINIGTGGAVGSTTNINIGDADGGTVSIARDLAVDTDVLKVDATNNRVGINVTSPTVALDVLGQLLVSGTASINGITLANMSGETKTNYLHFNPATTGTSQVGSVALVTVRGPGTGSVGTSGASSAAGFSGSASVNSSNQVGMGLYTNSVASTVTVLVGGGVGWTAFESSVPFANAITLRPSAGTWTAIWCGIRDSSSSSQIFNLVMLAIRNA